MRPGGGERPTNTGQCVIAGSRARPGFRSLRSAVVDRSRPSPTAFHARMRTGVRFRVPDFRLALPSPAPRCALLAGARAHTDASLHLHVLVRRAGWAEIRTSKGGVLFEPDRGPGHSEESVQVLPLEVGQLDGACNFVRARETAAEAGRMRQGRGKTTHVERDTLVEGSLRCPAKLNHVRAALQKGGESQARRGGGKRDRHPGCQDQRQNTRRKTHTHTHI